MGMLGLIFGNGTPKRLKLEYRSTNLQRREDGFISVRPESLSARKRQSLAESGTNLHTYHTPTDVAGIAPSHLKSSCTTRFAHFMMKPFAPTHEFLVTHTLTM